MPKNINELLIEDIFSLETPPKNIFVKKKNTKAFRYTVDIWQNKDKWQD